MYSGFQAGRIRKSKYLSYDYHSFSYRPFSKRCSQYFLLISGIQKKKKNGKYVYGYIIICYDADIIVIPSFLFLGSKFEISIEV